MKPFKVDNQGAIIDRLHDKLVAIRGDKIVNKQPIKETKQLIVVGNITLTADARAIIAKHHIDVVFLTKHNRFVGRLARNDAKFVPLRHVQLRQLANTPSTLSIAQAIVVGKLNNQRTLLRRQQEQLPHKKAQQNVHKAVAGIAKMIKGAQQATNIDSLRGFEGKAGAYYFGAWRVLAPKGFTFTGRAYYPPPDPINSMLSFGYALLTRDVTTAIQLVGLDPYLGFFHAVHDGRVSLALDLMEEFRVIIVDRMVLTLLKQRQITPADFNWTKNPKRPVLLSDPARKIVLKSYQKQLNTSITHPLAKEKMTYSEALKWQAQLLARVITGQAHAYHALTIK